ncbi:Ig-like domain-containing protein [Chiayiivirga flava]|uniref:Putative repeat protein (TIGR01451 family) n=1 Tax=Chiayiivirga flava TaxID=659595 RepID=A0A7W8G0X2_9GAMM|nr:Ig-like domain-containing protein [Chiayiivirga flava]MBB5208809.1 putative repeat protein (TIGR01451 family) [Chiayiivirga flava]
MLSPNRRLRVAVSLRAVFAAVSGVRRATAVAVLALLASLALPLSAQAQAVCALPGSSGSGDATGIVNTYYQGNGNLAAGATGLTLGTRDTRGSATGVAVGDLLLVIQMQDGAINASNNSNYGAGTGTGQGTTTIGNAGRHEFVRVDTVVGNAITFSPALTHAYTQAPATATLGQRRYQVVRVPQYISTTARGVTAPAWGLGVGATGETGGVVAMDVRDTLTLGDGVGATIENNPNRAIFVAGKGFRGGAGFGSEANSPDTDWRSSADTVRPHGGKGEGIAGTPRFLAVKDSWGFQNTNAPIAAGTNLVRLNTGAEGYPDGSRARGAPGNAGGGGTDGGSNNNQYNAGGGGGGNYAPGGLGGRPYNRPLNDTNGRGGAGYAGTLSFSRVFLGGGGGSGGSNNATVDPGVHENQAMACPITTSGNGDQAGARCSSGAAGGGVVILRARSVTGPGIIDARGAHAYNVGNDAAGGGGAGGSVVIYSIEGGTATINASGGDGGNAWANWTGTGCTGAVACRHGPGGGGGGGFVAFSPAAMAINATLDGGRPGRTTNGANDTYEASGYNGGTSAFVTPDTPGVVPGALCAPDLRLAKSNGGTTLVSPGTSIYSLTVSNVGSAASAGTITIVDVLPGGLSIANGAVPLTGPQAANWACTAATNVVTCTSATVIAAAGSSSFSFAANVIGSNGTAAVNRARVGGGGDPGKPTPTAGSAGACTGDNTPAGCATDADTINAPLLGITKSGGANMIAGGNASYTVTVTNLGAAPTAGAIRVVDVLPTGLTYTGTSPFVTGGFSCTYTAGTPAFFQCDRSTPVLAAGASAALVFPVQVAGTAPSALTNRAGVGGGGDPTKPGLPTTTTVGACPAPVPPATAYSDVASGCASLTSPVGRVDLRLEKDDGQNFVPVNGQTTYQFIVRNTGNAASTGTIALRDVLPAGLTWPVALTLGGPNAAAWACVRDANTVTVTCSSPVSIPAGGFSQFSLVANASAVTAGTLYTNKARITGGGDPDLGAVADDAAVNACTADNTPAGCALDIDVAQNAAQIRLAKSHPAGGVNPGSAVTFNLVVSNTGGTASSGTITVVDVLPAGVTPPANFSSGGFTCTVAGQVITCTSGASLAAGASVTISFSATVTASAATPVVNRAQAGGGGDPQNGTPPTGTTTAECASAAQPYLGCAVDTVLLNANLQMVKTQRAGTGGTFVGTPITIDNGQTIQFQLTVTNAGPATAANVAISDTLPSQYTGLSLVSATPTGTVAGCATGSFAFAGQVLSGSIASLASGASCALIVQATVNGTGTAIANTATVLVPPGIVDPTPGDNSSTVNTTIAAADLALVKADGNVTAVPGGSIAYTLTVTNNGPSTASAVSVSDTIPAGLTFVSAAGTGWSCGFAAGTVTCTRATLAAGVAPTITLTLGVPAGYAGANPVSNTASVTSSTTDPSPGNNADNETTPVGAAPQAVDDSATTPFQTPVTTTVLANDLAGGAPPLNPASVTIVNSNNGTAVPNPDGTITFTPAAGFTGITTYVYSVCDSSTPTPVCDTATVTVAVGPQANDDNAQTPYQTPLPGTVTGNDIAPPGAQYTQVTAPAGGSVVLNANGTYTYFPNPGFSGIDTFTYQVCLPAPNQTLCDPATVTIAVGPDAQNDTASTPQNTPLVSTVAGNDTAAPGSTYSIVTPPTSGSLVLGPNGGYTYTPVPGFSGPVTFTYQVCLPAPNQLLCDIATVTITVGGNTLVANDDSDSTAQNTPVTTVVLQNDTVTGAPLDPASVSIVTPSPNGTATPNPDGTVTFVPAPNFSGVTTYSYEVCDTSTPTPLCDTATVTITVAPNTVDAVDDGDSTAQNTPVTTPVIGNDTVPPGGAPLDPGSVAIVTPSPDGTATPNPDGSITFTPNPGFSGTTTYTYEVCDLSTPTPVCDTATVEIVVGANLVAAVDDSDSTPQNTPVTTAVLGNDTTTGAALDPGSVTITVPSADGTATVNPDGSITFTPAPNFSGTTTYSYQVCDLSTPTPVCDAAQVTITVDPNVVSALNDGDTTPQNTPVTTTVLGNDSVLPGGAALDPGSVSIVTPSPDGTLVVNPDGSIEFTPATNFSGTTTYTYEVCDLSTPTPVCDEAIVTITVDPNTIATQDDSDTTPQNTPVTTTVLLNDSSTGAPLDPGSVSIVAQSADGNAVAHPDGTVTFTPDPGFSGVTTYSYEVCDLSTPVPVCATALVTITVEPNTVVANPDTDNTPQNTPVTTTVLGNDSVDPTGAPLDPGSVSIVTPSPDGTAVPNPDGTVTFTPNPDFSGVATYIYQVCDTSVPDPVCVQAVVQVTVEPNVVSALNDADTTPQNTPVTTTVLDNDTVLPNGAALDPGSVSIVTPSPDGTLVVNPDGSVEFTPNTNFSGTTTYTYQVCDVSVPTPVCDQAVVTITVGDNTLDLQDDSDTTPQNTPVTTTVLLNDSSTGAPLDVTSVTVVAASPDGSAVPNADGTITFTPASNFSGTTSYSYQVCDLSTPVPVCSTALVTITVEPNVVAAVDDGAVTEQNTPVTTPVLGNDTVLPNGAPLDPASVAVTVPSPDGSAVVNPDGTITFTPNPGFSGTTTYTYEVCDLSTPTPVCDSAVVTVSIGDNLVAANDDSDTTPQNTPVTTPVLGNDTTTGAPLDPASVVVTVPSPNGSTVVNPDGSITFTPDDGFSGSTTYSYQVCDTSVPTPVCDTAVVTITVGDNLVVAVDDADSTPQNTPVTTVVLGNDSTTGAPLDPSSVTVTVPSPDGSTVVNPDGSITFTPNDGFSGTTTYSYEVCDLSTPTPVCDTAVVTITVAPNDIDALNDADNTPQNTPVTTSVLSNDTVTGAPLDPGSVVVTTPSPDGTTVVNPDGTITFTPAPNFSGVTTYSYQVCDTSTPTPLCDIAVVTITVGASTVVANNDFDSSTQNTPVTTPVLGNDSSSGASLDPGSVSIVTPSPDGTAVANPDGSITFTPNPGFSGTTTYVYQVCDVSTPTPVCDTALVTITIPPNVVAALNDNDETPQNTPVTVPVLGNDSSTDLPLDPGSVVVTVPSPDGSTVVNPDGSITFTPTPGFSGVTTFSYLVCDTSAPVPVCDEAVVTITVGTSTVTAVDDSGATPQDTPITLGVLGNDTSTGPALDPGSVAIVAQSADGTAVVNPDGSITFTPNPGFAGTTTYSYVVCDLSTPTPQCDTALVTIVVGGSTVIANDDTGTTPQDTPVTVPVIGNDTGSGPPLDPGSVTIVVPSPDGNLVVNPDGSITFTPNDGFSGETTYTYEVCDTTIPVPVCDTAVVTIEVGEGAIAAADDSDTTPQDTPVTTDVLANDSASQPLDPASVTVTVPSPDGSTVVNPDGSITFTPDADFFGVTMYTYRVCDTSTPTPVCDTAVVTITVPQGATSADLAVLKTGPANADAGEQIVFSIVVTNLGPDAADNVVLVDPTPAGLVFVGNGGDCATAFPCALGTLAVGDARTVLATFLVPDDYTGPSTVVNIASVSSDTPDPTPGDTSSSASTLVQGGGTPGPTPVPQPLNIPVDGRWAMLLLALSVMLLACLRVRRGA